MKGWLFSAWKDSSESDLSGFDKLLSLFQELVIHASGNVQEALSWLTQIDKEFELTDDSYSVSEFIDELIVRGLIEESKEFNRPKESICQIFDFAPKKGTQRSFWANP